ncbi:pilus assembly protein [Burkholderia sp. WAC0059]|uniref:type II secretion system F family protein n=1 Tax=Burkholderia sp. WAC0059 TaxID=2066022 RepID=UPI000C7E8D8F|nr:type II secretion system F family protein [Burkholderia sp. WAC0059]PLZ03379.1 pilus assembly protein [Burkholderia sp. WAC0059]
MSPADVVTLASFLAVMFAGLLFLSLRNAQRERPQARLRERLKALQSQRVEQRPAAADETTDLFRQQTPEGVLQAWLYRHRQRLNTVAGKHGGASLAFAALAGLIAGLALARLSLLPGWTDPLVVLAGPPLAIVLAYKRLIARFRVRFLYAFPDTIDLVIRATRAGVPITQAIATAGEQVDEPVRAEFKTMGDALKLGIDLVDVLEAANARIEIADFAFFSVCLRLQRETGGQLGETLENLSSIIRMRRDIRQKTKALTAEGKLTSRIIAFVPFFIGAAIYTLNRDYIEVLFTTGTGHRMLAVAAVLLTVGLTIVQKMARLDTSR